MREALRRALAKPDWDYLVKVDDDTLVIPRRVSARMSDLDRHAPLFFGGDIAQIASTTFQNARLGDRGRHQVPFFSGKAGYGMTRVALEHAWPELEKMLAVPGSEHISKTARPCSVTRGKKAAKQAMW